MAEVRRYSLGSQLDINQILAEAQHRWLRPAEICAILQTHTTYQISPEPPTRPPSGSIFLFDRKVLRYFRKDGHSWRKKKDGKTVKEAHERLKSGSIDVLHCYYAHGEENENFQRRSYWMLEEELSHIVLVHYREVKGTRANYNRIREADVIPESRQAEVDISNSEMETSIPSKFQQYEHRGASYATDTTSLNSPQTSEYEDVQSAYRHQVSPRLPSTHELQSPGMRNVEDGTVPYYPVPLSDDFQGRFSSTLTMDFGLTTPDGRNKAPLDNGFPYALQQDNEFPPWKNVVESTSGFQSTNFQPSLPSAQTSAMNMMLGSETKLLGQISGAYGKMQEFANHSNSLEEWQASDFAIDITNWSFGDTSDGKLNAIDKTEYPPLRQPSWHDLTNEVDDVNRVGPSNSIGLHNVYPSEQHERRPNGFQMRASNSGAINPKSESIINLDDDDEISYPPLRRSLLDGVTGGGLRKLDSFDRWMTNELGDVTESSMQTGSAAYWDTVGTEDGADDSGISTRVPLDNYVLSPSVSQDQFFTILDFTPNWAYCGTEVKVLVTGRFLRSQEEVAKHKWACMFGEVEVPAEILANGALSCYTPLHETGRVPFYVTCSNRLACSEVRDFEFRTDDVQDPDLADAGIINLDENLLHMRFGKLLSLEQANPQTYAQSNAAETSSLCSKISALLKDDTEWEQMLNFSKQDELSANNVKDQLLQKLFKEKLHGWLLQKVTQGGKGPSVLDEGGQGVLHFAAALGYDWAIPPTIAAGVSVNFRDANGWTALHWAACYGRERTVAFLISLGAAPGALTDPTPKYPLGRPPADLASCNGHKGISGYLAESELSSHLKSIDLKDSKASVSRDKAVETLSERTATPGGNSEGLSMKDSLAAVRNATQAAARIHQVYRVQSFQRKQVKDYGDSDFGISNEKALSRISVKSKKASPRDEPVHVAAVRIQNKFRSYKGRKDFLLTRQRIIKIQAHVRGHQVRKNYKKIIWSVGILDKVILRWRRKGRGLSGFKPEPAAAGTSSSSMQNNTETKEDEYDFLKKGRMQTEERLQKALARVKSMAQYPEARDQYRRLLNAVSEMEETKAAQDKVLNNQDVDFDEELMGLEALLEDDTFMSAVL